MMMTMASRPRVLVVDDDGALRDFLVAALGDAGYNVVAAANGQEALAALARLAPRWRPDLIVLDLEMPVLDGAGFAAHNRRWSAESPHCAQATPIVVISGAPDAATVAQRIGAVDLIDKPFDLDDFLIRIGRHVAGPVPGHVPVGVAVPVPVSTPVGAGSPLAVT